MYGIRYMRTVCAILGMCALYQANLHHYKHVSVFRYSAKAASNIETFWFQIKCQRQLENGEWECESNAAWVTVNITSMENRKVSKVGLRTYAVTITCM